MTSSIHELLDDYLEYSTFFATHVQMREIFCKRMHLPDIALFLYATCI